jgi:hypothetical protein
MLQSKFIQAVGTGLQETDTIAGRVMLNKTKEGKKVGHSKSLNTIKNDFDVKKWAAPEFLEAAAKELIEERWQKLAGEKLSMPTSRLG